MFLKIRIKFKQLTEISTAANFNRRMRILVDVEGKSEKRTVDGHGEAVECIAEAGSNGVVDVQNPQSGSHRVKFVSAFQVLYSD